MATRGRPPKKSRRVTTEEFDGSPVDRDEEHDPFERARQDFGGAGDVKLKVYRYDDDFKQQFLKTVDFTPDLITPEWIRSRWGPGAYVLRFLNRDDGQEWSQVFRIAADEKPQAAAPVAAHQPNFDLVSVLQKQNEILFTALLNRQTQPATSSSDPAILEFVKSATASVFHNAFERPDTSQTLLGFFERALQIAQDSKSDSDGSIIPQLIKAAREVLPELTKMRAAGPYLQPAPIPAKVIAIPMREGVPPPPGVSAHPGSVGFVRPVASEPVASPSSSPSPESNPSDTMIDGAVASYAGEVLDAFREGTPPGEVASAILDSIPRNFWDRLQALTAGKIIALAPELGAFRPKVDELVGYLHDPAVLDDEAS